MTTPKMQLKPSFFPLLLVLATTGTGYLLPNPPGKYNVTMTTGTLTDYTRGARELLLTVIQPTTCTSTGTVPVPYMPNKTAENEGPWISKVFGVSSDIIPLFLEARLPVCPETSTITGRSCSSHAPAPPLLLLLPGYRSSRIYFHLLASSIASQGLTVITMDHPGETHSITYPDGHTNNTDLPNPTNSIDELAPYAPIRATDASFILDQLSNTTAMAALLPHDGHKRLQTDRIAIAGHSLGGAAAIIAAARDARFKAVVNWDGPFFGAEGLSHPLPNPGTTAGGFAVPVLYLATDREDDPRMLAVWPELLGPKLWVKMKTLQHQGMMDFGSLFKAKGQDVGELKALLGSMDSGVAMGIITAYTSEWIKGVFGGQGGLSKSELLQGNGGAFSDLSVLLKENF